MGPGIRVDASKVGKRDEDDAIAQAAEERPVEHLAGKPAFAFLEMC